MNSAALAPAKRRRGKSCWRTAGRSPAECSTYGCGSWERPEVTTARLVLEQIDRTHLDRYSLAVSWAAKDHADPDLFKVALFTGNDDYCSGDAGYQVFLRFPRRGRSPAEVAAEVIEELQHAIKPGGDQPPPMAGGAGSTNPSAGRRGSKARADFVVGVGGGVGFADLAAEGHQVLLVEHVLFGLRA